MKPKTKKRLTVLIFLSPWIITFFVFELYPLLYSLFVSFTKYSGLNPQATFIGLENYARAFQDEVFIKSVLNTLIFVAGTLPFTIAIAILIAILLNHLNLKFNGLFKAGFFLPSMISMVVISMIWIYMYSGTGFFNTVLHFFGFAVEERSWLANQNTALGSIMIMDVWASFGYYMILIYAGLQNIPYSVYEAARIDGAKPIQIAFKITIPMIRPTLFFVIALNTIRSFQIFTEVFTMTNGGPRNSTETIVHYLYRVSFRNYEMGYGSAIAYILLAIIMTITLIQKRALRSDYL
ncbi:MAG TPA: sugar ABC transporter permease [Petrotogaceae bacterium]|nr:sugar ABC transporter permease [Petrotogaceae bacterium]HPO26802.1 sugar ABC transporter permease [Petrotogaceae bacterium]HQO12245.1 sugar ABC transporter permease [Petrotogaceae bacterium]HQP59333.1 sugar ABC transporter permease [Petrotogaceae bacterium]